MFIGVCDVCDPAWVGPERVFSDEACADFDAHVATPGHQAVIAGAMERKRQELADLAALEAATEERFASFISA